MTDLAEPRLPNAIADINAQFHRLDAPFNGKEAQFGRVTNLMVGVVLNQSTEDWHTLLVTLSEAKGLDRPRCFAALSMTRPAVAAKRVPMSCGPI